MIAGLRGAVVRGRVDLAEGGLHEALVLEVPLARAQAPEVLRELAVHLLVLPHLAAGARARSEKGAAGGSTV